MKHVQFASHVWGHFMAYFRSAFNSTCLSLMLIGLPMSAFSRTLTIGSYNLENLWDHRPHNTAAAWQDFVQVVEEKARAGLRSSPQYDDYSASGSNWYEPHVLTAKVRNVVHAVDQAGAPDILGLQEIESAGNRSEVWDIPCGNGCTLRGELRKLGYRYFLIGKQDPDNPVSVTTAFISKIPIRQLERISIKFSDRYSQSARDIQVVEASIGQTRLVLFNGHFKSKRGVDSERFRNQSAQALRERISQERAADPSVRVIALGDFNSAYGEEPMLQMGATSDKREMLGEPSSKLYNLWYELKPGDRWEHSWDGLKSTLSHILLGDRLFLDQGVSYVDGSYHVVGHHGDTRTTFLGPDGRPFRWQIRPGYRYAKHAAYGYSDHLPLVAEFEILPTSSRYPARKRQDYRAVEHEPMTFGEKLMRPNHCTEAETVDYEDVRPDDIADLVGRCLRIQAPQGGLPISTIGVYSTNQITLPIRMARQSETRPIHFALTMNRSYDWRPNIDDRRVDLDQLMDLDPIYGSRNVHPRSNKCFLRKVLQGEGGRVDFVVGRVGYLAGYLSLFVSTRQSHHIRLSELPEAKTTACPWD